MSLKVESISKSSALLAMSSSQGAGGFNYGLIDTLKGIQEEEASNEHAYYQTTTDWDVLGKDSETANRQEIIAQRKIAKIEKEENDKDKDSLDRESQQAMETMDETRASYVDGLYSVSIGGVDYQFTDEDLEDTIRDIKDNPNAFADKYGLTEEQTNEAMELALLLENASPEERAQILQEWGEKNPAVAQAVSRESREKGLEHDNFNDYKSGNTETISSTQASAEISSEQVVLNQKTEVSLIDDLDSLERMDTTLSHAEMLDGNTREGSETKIAKTHFNSATEGGLNNIPAPQQDQNITTEKTVSLTA